jgi:hypothetical protein
MLSRAPRAAPKVLILIIMWSKTAPDHVLQTFKTQGEAIDWAKKNGHTPVRHLNDKQKADHWRSV